MIRTTSRRPLDLTAVRGRLDRWRRTRAHPRSPIPTALWADAVALARQQGLYPTARALHLDYGGLKAHVEAAEARGRGDRPTFVEVAGSSALARIDPGLLGRSGPPDSSAARARVE